MTHNEVISKLIVMGFTKKQNRNILRYKEIMDIYMPSDIDKIFYSTYSAKQHDHIIPIDNNSLPAIIKFIEDNSNDS